MPADLPAPAQDLEEAVAATLERLADPAPADAARPPADFSAVLQAAEEALAFSGQRVPADEVANSVTQRLELYRTLVRLVSRLDPSRVNLSPADTTESAERTLANGEHRS